MNTGDEKGKSILKTENRSERQLNVNKFNYFG